MGVILRPILRGPNKASKNSGLFLQTIAIASPGCKPSLKEIRKSIAVGVEL